MTDPDSTPKTGTKDVGGGVVAVVLVLVGALVYHDTLSYADGDSSVFPRTVSIVLMVISALVALVSFLGGRRNDGESVPGGSWPRRLLLPLVMLGPVLLMKAIGFLPAMLVMFAALLLVANYDDWTPRRAVIYLASGAGVVGAFYLVFRYWLQVPLP